MKNKCTQCRWEYPDELLQPLQTGEGVIGQMCGICALAWVNEMHGLKREKFDGENAEDLRLRAIQWRKDHANKRPKAN